MLTCFETESRPLSSRHTLPAIVVAVATLVTGCIGQTRPESALATEGAELYRMHCAACHGAAGRGDGPVAPLMAISVPDLTRIAARRGGRFPEDEVARIIDGLSPLAAHGARHMPVWGYEFYPPDGDDEAAYLQVTERVERLTRFLGSMQQAGKVQDQD
jgi:mono/diheme cytochrome c family protein